MFGIICLCLHLITHPNLTVKALPLNYVDDLIALTSFTSTVTEKQFSRAFGGLCEKSASSPSGLYNAHYICLSSKINDNAYSPNRKIHSQLMELPIKHGFAAERHLTLYDLAIYKKTGDYRSKKLRLVHRVKET
jgi:hypothetical protein